MNFEREAISQKPLQVDGEKEEQTAPNVCKLCSACDAYDPNNERGLKLFNVTLRAPREGNPYGSQMVIMTTPSNLSPRRHQRASKSMHVTCLGRHGVVSIFRRYGTKAG